MLPVTRVRIVGPSMAPALRNGEWWIAVRGRRMRTGDVVLLRHPDRPDLMIVKRLARRTDAGWWVLGDNPDQSEDSRQFGPVAESDLLGRLTWRYHPIRRTAD